MRKILLRFLNRLENTPSYYAKIDNIEHYSKEFISSFKGKTINQFLKEMKRMDDCLSSGKCGVTSENGVFYDDLTNHF